MDLQSTVSVKEISRVIHPSPWRADWQRRWDARRTGIGGRDDFAELCGELMERLGTCSDCEAYEVTEAARYAVESLKEKPDGT